MKNHKIQMCGCDCWSLPYDIIKKVKGYETLTHTFKKQDWRQSKSEQKE